MTVAELVEKLEHKDPDMKVAIATDSQGSKYMFIEESGEGLLVEDSFYKNEDELERYDTGDGEVMGLRCFVLWPEEAD